MVKKWGKASLNQILKLIYTMIMVIFIYIDIYMYHLIYFDQCIQNKLKVF